MENKNKNRKYQFSVELNVEGDTLAELIKGYKKAAVEFLDYLEEEVKKQEEAEKKKD